MKRLSSKVFPSAAAAVADIIDGSTLLVGGFGLCGKIISIENIISGVKRIVFLSLGIPQFLIEALKESGPKYCVYVY